MQYSNAASSTVENERVIVLDASTFKPSKESLPPSALDKLFFNKPVKVHLRETAALFSAILFIISAVSLYRARSESLWEIYAGIGALMFISGYYVPWSFYPVWKLWMGIASVLEKIMTAVIISISWFGIFIPFSFVARTFGAKPLDLSFAQASASYWENRTPESSDFKFLERQF